MLSIAFRCLSLFSGRFPGRPRLAGGATLAQSGRSKEIASGGALVLKAFLTFLAAYVLSQFYRAFLAVIAPELSRELGLDPQALGNLQALWIAGFVVMQFPVGWALDTLGPRRVISGLMILAVAGALLFARAHSAAQVDFAMTLIGMGCSAVYMGAIYALGRATSPDRFAGLASGLLGLGAAGNLLASSPMGFAASVFGWRAAMMLVAGLTAASALTVFLLIEDPPRLARHGSDGFFAGLGEILGLRALWPILPLTAVGYSVVFAERGLWAGPFFAQVYGLDPFARGNAILAMAIAMSLGALSYGPLDRIFGTRKWVVAGGSLVTSLCFLALGFFALPLGPAIALMAALGAFGLTYGVLMAHGRAFFPERLLGRGITTMNVFFIGGAGVLQPLSGAYMSSMRGEPPALAFQRLHLAFGGLLMAALLVYLFAREARKT